MLPKTKREQYKKVITPYLRDKSSYKLENQVKTDFLQRYILWRVMNLGYDTDLFGQSDRYLNYNRAGRNGDKIERIGKKYQWIAYFEILAIISDNFTYSPRYDYEDNPKSILHLKQFRYADQIDPTVLIKKQSDRPILEDINNFKFKKSNIDEGVDNIAWLKETKGIYDISKLAEVTDKSKNNWLLLSGMYDFAEEVPPEEDKYSKKRKRQWYILNSYLYKIENHKQVSQFIKETNFIGRWMPENRDWIDPYFGEFGWSEYYKHLIPTEEWKPSDSVPFPYKHTNESFLYEQGVYDCSMEESISLNLPSHTIMNEMKLSFGKIDGQYVNSKEEIVAFYKDKNLTNLTSEVLVKNPQEA